MEPGAHGEEGRSGSGRVNGRKSGEGQASQVQAEWGSEAQVKVEECVCVHTCVHVHVF